MKLVKMIAAAGLALVCGCFAQKATKEFAEIRPVDSFDLSVCSCGMGKRIRIVKSVDGHPLKIGLADMCPTNGETKVLAAYRDAVIAAGDVPVVLPRQSDTNRIAKLMDGVDLLLLCGGVDVDPARYGEEPSPKLGTVNAVRDEFEWKLLDEAVRRRLPVFGICRGMQLINVYFGGTLVQDIPSEIAGGLRHRKEPEDADFPWHAIGLAPSSRLAAVLGCTNMTVNSYHHQSVEKVAPGFRVTARSADGVAEAFEGEDYPAAGVQFHPERMMAADAGHPVRAVFERLLFLSGKVGACGRGCRELQ